MIDNPDSKPKPDDRPVKRIKMWISEEGMKKNKQHGVYNKYSEIPVKPWLPAMFNESHY